MTDRITDHGPLHGPRETSDATPSQPALSPAEVTKLLIMRRVPLDSVWQHLRHCPIITLERSEVLLETGQANQTMFLVLAGALSVHLDSPQREPVAMLEAGQTVGELSVIDDHPASAYVIAAQPSRLLSVDEDTFWQLVTASHEFATNLLVLFAQRMRANNSAITENARLKRHFEQEARVDGLTGLHNRRWLDETLERLHGRHARSDHALSVIILDVDHFKLFNDDYGHAAGDEVLTTIARVMYDNLRPTDLAARYGGEEFVMILPRTEIDGALSAAERLRRAVAATRLTTADGRKLPSVHISLGVAQLSAADGSGADMLRRADAALYEAKETGRNRVVAAKSDLSG